MDEPQSPPLFFVSLMLNNKPQEVGMEEEDSKPTCLTDVLIVLEFFHQIGKTFGMLLEAKSGFLRVFAESIAGDRRRNDMESLSPVCRLGQERNEFERFEKRSRPIDKQSGQTADQFGKANTNQTYQP